MQLTDIPFDDAPNVSAIRYRLHPLDVGFDLRTERIAVAIDCTGDVRVSYADQSGERRVMSGPVIEVVEALRAIGYDVLTSAPEPSPAELFREAASLPPCTECGKPGQCSFGACNELPEDNDRDYDEAFDGHPYTEDGDL